MSRLYCLAALKRPVGKNKANKASMAINEIMDPLYILKTDGTEDDMVEDLDEDDEDDLDEDEDDEEEDEEEETI